MNDNKPPSSVMNRLSPLLPLVLLLLHGFLYNGVGKVAAARQVDFGPMLEMPWDGWIPFVPLFVIPYTLVWFYPLGLTGYLVAARVEPRVFRSMAIALVALLVACYALWIAFPVKVGLRLDEGALAGQGWLHDLVLFNYQGASHWNACPSFHVAGPWFLYRAARLVAPRLPSFFFWLFVAIALSTVLIRIHYALDIVGGLLVSELAIRGVFHPLLRPRSLPASDSFPPPQTQLETHPPS